MLDLNEVCRLLSHAAVVLTDHCLPLGKENMWMWYDGRCFILLPADGLIQVDIDDD